MKKLTLSLLSSLLAFASAAAQDYTSYIVNPSFENGTEGWEVTNLALQSNSSFVTNDGVSLKDGNNYLEKWVSKGSAAGTASAVQEIKNLPLGKYTVTVSAQNLDQNDKTKACTGVTVYGKSTIYKAVITLPGEYTTKSFDNNTGTVKIGFSATSATGNWLALDNFRLTKVGDIATTQMMNVLNSKLKTAKTKVGQTMSKDALAALNKAIALAETMTSTNTPDEINAAINDLNSTMADADASISEYSTLATKINTAEEYLPQYMQKSIADSLDAAIIVAKAISSESTSQQVKDAISKLTTLNSEAYASINAYSSLSKAIDDAEAAYDASMKGAAEYYSYLLIVKKMYTERTATTTEAKTIAAKMPDAILAFRINNPTPGTGAPVSVTSTNHFMPTGATQALMRAEFKGDNILEKGVCWSTQHNPTVTDNRTTKAWTLNGAMYHLSGLTPATVYYVRPYVLNNTYEIAYGDEVKIVTHPKGNCTGSWNEGAPDEAANNRCRTAIQQTIDYFNEWTGINGFHLSGNYGASTPTADCSYGGWMRIGPNAGNQAIGTVLHETGHGVGVGTSSRYADSNLHSWKWFGREANKIYSFLENKEADPYTSDFCMVGDGTHAWGASASYDWFVNGADKDKHIELQYAGGCMLLYGMFIDGLNPTYSYSNGIPGYTYNFDDRKTYYIMCKSDQRGLGTGLVGANISSATGAVSLKWRNILNDVTFVSGNDTWKMSYNASTGYYQFKNVGTGRYLSRTASVVLKDIAAPSASENFQLMPDRTNVTIGEGDKQFTTHGYWFTWDNSGSRAMSSNALSGTAGTVTGAAFNFADAATTQQYIIISEDELTQYRLANGFVLGDVNLDGTVDMKDAKLIADYFAGTITKDNFAKELADMNGDGKITIDDANIIVNMFVK